ITEGVFVTAQSNSMEPLRTQNQNVRLPSLPPGLSHTHQEMFLAARGLLKEPGDITKKKEAFIIISGIVNTLLPTGLWFTISPMIASESRMPCLLLLLYISL
ncbi:hypothetical protein BGZ95_005569, partial [Linnemannia exigua]